MPMVGVDQHALLEYLERRLGQELAHRCLEIEREHEAQIRLGAALCAALLLSGCANGYEKFYQAAPPFSIGIVPFTGEPQLSNASGPTRTTRLTLAAWRGE